MVPSGVTSSRFVLELSSTVVVSPSGSGSEPWVFESGRDRADGVGNWSGLPQLPSAAVRVVGVSGAGVGVGVSPGRASGRSWMLLLAWGGVIYGLLGQAERLALVGKEVCTVGKPALWERPALEGHASAVQAARWWWIESNTTGEG